MALLPNQAFSYPDILLCPLNALTNQTTDARRRRTVANDAALLASAHQWLREAALADDMPQEANTDRERRSQQHHWTEVSSGAGRASYGTLAWSTASAYTRSLLHCFCNDFGRNC